MSEIIPIETIEGRILVIREQRVMLDADLAELYGITTKALNQAVRRNDSRFPLDFMFQLTKLEKDELVTVCDRFKNLKHSTSLPYAFTEHGAIMLANVLRSSRAVQVSIQVVRAFVKLRQMLTTHRELARRIEELEKKYDAKFKAVFDAISQSRHPLCVPNPILGLRLRRLATIHWALSESSARSAERARAWETIKQE